MDEDSVSNIITLEAYDELGLNISDMKCIATTLFGFGDGSIILEGLIMFLVALNGLEKSTTVMVDFLVINYLCSFNMTMG